MRCMIRTIFSYICASLGTTRTCTWILSAFLNSHHHRRVADAHMKKRTMATKKSRLTHTQSSWKMMVIHTKSGTDYGKIHTPSLAVAKWVNMTSSISHFYYSLWHEHVRAYTLYKYTSCYRSLRYWRLNARRRRIMYIAWIFDSHHVHCHHCSCLHVLNRSFCAVVSIKVKDGE